MNVLTICIVILFIVTVVTVGFLTFLKSVMLTQKEVRLYFTKLSYAKDELIAAQTSLIHAKEELIEAKEALIKSLKNERRTLREDLQDLKQAFEDEEGGPSEESTKSELAFAAISSFAGVAKTQHSTGRSIDESSPIAAVALELHQQLLDVQQVIDSLEDVSEETRSKLLNAVDIKRVN